MNTDPILVTGANGGIGSAICQMLRVDGHNVVATDRAFDTSASAQIVAQLPGDIEVLMAALPARLSGAVFAAGTIATHAATDFDAASFERIFEINVRAPIELTARLADRFAPGTSVVFIGSVAGLRASPNNLLYGASKAALHNAALTFAKTLAPRRIRVNTVCPGLIQTELTSRTNEDLARLEGSDPLAIAARRTQAIPIGRIGEPGDVAALVAFLMSDKASFITGEAFKTDGGGCL